MTRYWGFWTRGKLDVLRRYLDAFTTASSGVSERIYLDLFGGQPSNRERWTHEDFDGSARLALSTDSPPFTRLRFFELDRYAAQLEGALRPEFLLRNFKVVPGDCNDTVPRVLDELRPFNWAPTFAFVDPNGADIHWSTIEALSTFKKPTLSKTEMWILFADGMFTRTLPKHGWVRSNDAEHLTSMYGTEAWTAIYEARVDNLLTPTQARDEYVNLMRFRLEHLLGYKWTHPLRVVNEGGSPLYHMIFATDNSAGNRIMTSLYNSAANEFPAMRAAARKHRSGVHSLFNDDDFSPVEAREKLYVYEAPTLPFGTVDS